jgi:transcriptional regulator with XRE-family HTH domain
MCHDQNRCLDAIISDTGYGNLTRPEQAEKFGVARSQLLAVIAGRELPTVIARIADGCRIEADEIRTAMTTSRCPLRRATRPRNPYGERVVKLCEEQSISLDELRAKTTVDRTSFYHALGIGGRPGLAHLGEVANALGVDVATLAELIGEPVDHPLDTERLAQGLSRRQFARARNVTVAKLFELASPRTPSEAYRVTLARTGDVNAAKAAAAAVATKVHTEIGSMLRTWLDTNSATPTELSKRLGVARQSVVAWSAGVALPTDATQIDIANIIGVDITEVRAAVRADRQQIKNRRRGSGATLRALRMNSRSSRVDFASRLGCSVLQLRLAESGHLPDVEITVLVDAAHGLYEPLAA